MKNTTSITLAHLTTGATLIKAQSRAILTKARLDFISHKIKSATFYKLKSILQNSGLKTSLALVLLALFTFTAAAQKTAVTDAFSKYGLDASILNAENLQQPDNFAYDFKQTTTTAGKVISTVARFDPSGAKDEQWTVISTDGKSPSKSDINTFRKNHSKPAPALADESSYKVEKETPDYLVISYKLNPAAADKEAAMLKDCRQYMTVNLKTRKLEKIQTLNEKPFKIKILNAEKFDLVTRYLWNDQAKRYFGINEDLNILAKFMGQAVTIQTVTEYSNYIKK